MSDGDTTSWIAAAVMLAMAIVMVFAFLSQLISHPLGLVLLSFVGAGLLYSFWQDNKR